MKNPYVESEIFMGETVDTSHFIEIHQVRHCEQLLHTATLWCRYIRWLISVRKSIPHNLTRENKIRQLNNLT